jgi:hypothetical protein
MIGIPKPVRKLDEAYLDHIRGLKCIGLYLLSGEDRRLHAITCQYVSSQRSEANHIRKACFTGLRTKPSDKGFTLPFCQVFHNLYTQLGHRRFMERFNLDEKSLFDEMRRIEQEYDAANRTRRPIIHRSPRAQIGKLQITCVCGDRHAIPVTRTLIRNGALHFWCITQKKNVTIELRKRA